MTNPSRLSRLTAGLLALASFLLGTSSTTSSPAVASPASTAAPQSFIHRPSPLTHGACERVRRGRVACFRPTATGAPRALAVTPPCLAYPKEAVDDRTNSCFFRDFIYSVYQVTDGKKTLIGRANVTVLTNSFLRTSGAPDAKIVTDWDVRNAWGAAKAFTVHEKVGSCAPCSTLATSKLIGPASESTYQILHADVRFGVPTGGVRNVGSIVYVRAGVMTKWIGSNLHGFRCDKRGYIGSRGGCVYAGYVPTALMHLKSDYPKTAAHIANAQKALTRHWGSQALGGAPLTRNRSKITVNRSAAQAKCKKLGVKGTCDEYSFASTDQGCAFYTCHVAGVPWDDNVAQGRALNRFYVSNRVLDGDAFWVKVVN